MKIHISQSTKSLIDLKKSYKIVERGKIEVKGKGEMKTYFVLCKLDTRGESIDCSYMNVYEEFQHQEMERMKDSGSLLNQTRLDDEDNMQLNQQRNAGFGFTDMDDLKDLALSIKNKPLLIQNFSLESDQSTVYPNTPPGKLTANNQETRETEVKSRGKLIKSQSVESRSSAVSYSTRSSIHQDENKSIKQHRPFTFNKTVSIEEENNKELKSHSGILDTLNSKKFIVIPNLASLGKNHKTPTVDQSSNSSLCTLI